MCIYIYIYIYVWANRYTKKTNLSVWSWLRKESSPVLKPNTELGVDAFCVSSAIRDQWNVEKMQLDISGWWRSRSSLSLFFNLRFDFSEAFGIPWHLANWIFDKASKVVTAESESIRTQKLQRPFIFGQLDSLMIQVICFFHFHLAISRGHLLGPMAAKNFARLIWLSSIKGIGQAPNLSSGRRRFAQSKDCVHLVLWAVYHKDGSIDGTLPGCLEWWFFVGDEILAS